VRSRGADRPDDDADQGDEQPGRGRRLFGRGRVEPVAPEEVPQEETGWLSDLWTAKEERAAIGPGSAAGEARTSKSGRVAPGPDGDRAEPSAAPAPRARPREDRAPAPSPFGRSGVVGRPVSPPPDPRATSGAPAGAQPSWQRGSGEHTGAWQTFLEPGARQGTEADSPTRGGRHNPAPPSTPENGPGHGRRQLDPGRLPGAADAVAPSSPVPVSGNAPEVPQRAAPVPHPRLQDPGTRPGRAGRHDDDPGRREDDPGRREDDPGRRSAGSGPPPRGVASTPGPGADRGTGRVTGAPAESTGSGRGGVPDPRPAGHARPEPPGGQQSSDDGGQLAQPTRRPDPPRGGPRPEAAPGGYRPAPPQQPARHDHQQPGHVDGGAARAAVRPSAGSSRPVSAMPGGDSTGFGSRNTIAPGRARPDAYPSAPVTGGGRHGLPDADEGSRAAAPPGAALQSPARRTGTGAVRPAAAARASAPVAPPVVPGRQGVRTPAVPGRAGAMAGSTSGVIPRPGETGGRASGTGRAPVARPAGIAPLAGQPVGRVDAPGHPPVPVSPAPGDPGTGPVRRSGRDPGAAPAGPGTGSRPARAAARVTGAAAASAVVPAPVDQPDGRSAAWAAAVVANPAAGAGGTSRAVAAVRPAAEPDAPANAAPQPGGLRSELRRQVRAQRRLRVITLLSLSVVVLGLLPLIFGIRAATRDPVFTSLNALTVPSWAAGGVQDQSSGSRWCFLDCRFRERTAQSLKPYRDTANAYFAALNAAGWQRWQVGECPEQPVADGSYTCWRRDEFTLDLWVGPPECAVDQVAAQDPAALPSAGVVPTTPAAKCVGSTVSIKVQNAITDLRGRTEPKPDPSLIGETPDPVLSNDPLLEPTPARS
jgi:hypothetical protein